jgi:hypothetical protein
MIMDRQTPDRPADRQTLDGPHHLDRRTRSIRIVIADDHPIFRDGLRRLLESEPDMKVVG